jgi:hypothetical protein
MKDTKYLLFIFIVIPFFAVCQGNKGRVKIDSIIHANPKLKEYTSLTYCHRINYMDSIVDKDEFAFFSQEFKLVMLDISTKAQVDPEMDFDSKAYFSKGHYYLVSKKCRKKLGCKKRKSI